MSAIPSAREALEIIADPSQWATRKWDDPHTGLFDVALFARGVLAGMDANGWMPIETAPRDGTPVLLHRAPGEWPFVGFWGNPYRYHKKGKEAWIGHEYGLLEDKDGLVWKHLEIPS